MKYLRATLLLIFLFALTLGCQAATPAFSDFDTNQFGVTGNKVRIKPGVVITNATVNGGSIHATTTLSIPAILPSINPGAYYHFLLKIDDSTNLYSTTLVMINTTNGNLKLFLPANTPLLGLNGLGEIVPSTNLGLTEVTINNVTITNNAFINNVTVTNTAIFKGNAQFTSNAYFLNLNFVTNALSTVTIAAGKTAQALSTNNNISFTGFSGLDGTNAQPFTLLITNTAGSASPKFYQFPAGTIMLAAPFTNGVYNTNQGVFSGWIYPGFGTNATWTGF